MYGITKIYHGLNPQNQNGYYSKAMDRPIVIHALKNMVTKDLDSSITKKCMSNVVHSF